MKVCACHGEPMLKVDQWWRCAVKRRASVRRAQKKYEQSAKGRAANLRYLRSEKGRATRVRYEESPHGFAMRAARFR